MNLGLTAHKEGAWRWIGILAFTRAESIKTQWNLIEQEKQDLREQFRRLP